MQPKCLNSESPIYRYKGLVCKNKIHGHGVFYELKDDL